MRHCICCHLCGNNVHVIHSCLLLSFNLKMLLEFAFRITVKLREDTHMSATVHIPLKCKQLLSVMGCFRVLFENWSLSMLYFWTLKFILLKY